MINFNFIKNFIINIGKKKEEDKRFSVEKAAKSIDAFGLFLMHQFGKRPEGQRHFNDRSMSSDQKNSVQRLVDFDIVTFESQNKDGRFEYAYHWTEFGDKVMKYLNIIK